MKVGEALTVYVLSYRAGIQTLNSGLKAWHYLLPFLP